MWFMRASFEHDNGFEHVKFFLDIKSHLIVEKLENSWMNFAKENLPVWNKRRLKSKTYFDPIIHNPLFINTDAPNP